MIKLTSSRSQRMASGSSKWQIFGTYMLIFCVLLLHVPGCLGEYINTRDGIADHQSNHIADHHQSSSPEVAGYYDDELYEDDKNPLVLHSNWGEGVSQNETNEISEVVEQEELESDAVYGQHLGRPRINKCCDFGEGLNAQGLCKKLPEEDLKRHRNAHWFPDRVLDPVISNWTIPDDADWDITVANNVQCHPHETAEVIYDTNLFAIVANGELFLPNHKKGVAAGGFCVDLVIGKGRAVRSCFTKDELCQNSDCLRKCCPEGTMVDESTTNCFFHSNNRFPKDTYNVIHGTPACPHGQYKTPISGFFNIGHDGGLLTSSLNVSFLNYCLDFFMEQPPSSSATKSKRSYVSSIGSIPSSINDNRFDVEKIEDTIPSQKPEYDDASSPTSVLKAIVCFDSSTDAIAKKRNGAGLISVPREMSITYGVAFVLSSVCIALAAFISWRLPELRSLHGKCQLSHLATLFALFLLLAIIHLGSDSLVDYTNFCTFLAVGLHTATLSAFLWLNLLCVNIYLTFRSLRPPLAARRDENKRLIFLCVYAWGIPFSFCLFLFLLDRTPGRLEPMPRPEYGNYSCLISNRTAMFYYLYGPVGFLLLLNGVLFCLTARELLCGLWRLDNSDSLAFRRKSMGIVVAKLGIVMGMGWILDVLSWAVGNKPYIFYIADLFNGLQGVFMFLILIWRKRVLEVLKLRKPSVIKDETLTARPFLLPSKSLLNTTGNTDAEASLVFSQDS